MIDAFLRRDYFNILRFDHCVFSWYCFAFAYFWKKFFCDFCRKFYFGFVVLRLVLFVFIFASLDPISHMLPSDFSCDPFESWKHTKFRQLPRILFCDIPQNAVLTQIPMAGLVQNLHEIIFNRLWHTIIVISVHALEKSNGAKSGQRHNRIYVPLSITHNDVLM